ncbi:hypothetical protein [Acinetobacter towneri]|uniref:HEPN AbiU2-like domain-containing protein n=1 Tax=Acinetobacter towneri TaxID=202956 RepID=A0AB35LWQ7_9GAMM|nr:hypothetical protein [Acinetobacter towneri]MDM1717685.1 hypothetical protein [Acinetobacter towneri]MDM1729753.1 hypothetical protein [Acinetobacter towneri]MDM1732380.1 hypothetical protein [Acinetobacter towneri]MDM1743021.1 hypothetical protein [Acinetobacter towneri]MDM1745692.1 hypothetical protein [Acinetobacter towneri]
MNTNDLQERSNLMRQYLADLLLCIYTFNYKKNKFCENFGKMGYEETVLEKVALNTLLDSIHLRLANLADRDPRVYSLPQLREAAEKTITDTEILEKIEATIQGLYNTHLKSLNTKARNAYIAHINESFERIWSLWKDDEHEMLTTTKAVLDYFDLLTQTPNTYPAKFGSDNVEFDLREKLGL